MSLKSKLEAFIIWIGFGDILADTRGYYVCGSCGYKLSKRDAKISGYDRHIHCPQCGRKLDSYVSIKEPS